MYLKKLAGGGAVLALAAFAASAASADVGKGTYEFVGIIASVAPACAPIAFELPAAGSVSYSTFIYPGAKKTGLQSLTPGTGPSGPAISSTCIATAAVPAAGINGATIPVSCTEDTQTGVGSPASSLTETYTVTATAVATSWSVVTVLNLGSVVPGCTLTANGTWTAE